MVVFLKEKKFTDASEKSKHQSKAKRTHLMKIGRVESGCPLVKCYVHS